MDHQEKATPIRIQIVEDEAIVAHNMRMHLESMGYAVTGIASGEQQALELARRHRPDLVLMDINLGRGGDGTRAAGALSRDHHLPVVYLTAYAGDEILQKAMEAAPYGYLLKPFEPRELNAAIRSAVARARAEQRTREAEQRLRLALESGRLAVMDLDRARQEVALEGYMQQLLSSPSRSFTLTLEAFFHHLEDDEVRTALREMLATGRPVEICVAWRREDGQRAWVDIQASYLADDERVVGILRDVTDKVEAEERLRLASVVFETAGDGILILDRERRVRVANAAFEKITGWTLADVVGRDPDDFLHAARWPDRKAVGGLAGAIAAPSVEITCRRRDDVLFPAWETLAPVIDANGRITHYVLSFCDISALRNAESRLTHIALHDALTGLGNRHQLDISLRHNISRAATNEGSGRFALLFVDLDGFKNINDSLSHTIGDELLVEVARRLKRILRAEDVAIRMGGDEFLVIADDVGTTEAAIQLARKLLHVVVEPIATSIGQNVSISASVGIALFPEHADNADELVREADAAMYEAKAAGRNRYAVFSDTLTHRALERLQLEQGLRVAISGRQLELQWQPVMDMASGRIRGAEALLRWTHPVSGRISPERFIPLAEETGLILAIGDWVIEEVCRWMAHWLAQGVDAGRLAVNVSARQLQQEGFADTVAGLLRRYALPPDRLEIELTESSLQRGEQVQIALHQLRSLGVLLALDDFGTGFSSLSMLKFLPLNRLKIDRSFIRDISSDPNDLAIARTIAAMAETLGLDVTAEGVETASQRDVLLGLDVRDAQGWLYHPALPAAEFEALLRRQQSG